MFSFDYFEHLSSSFQKYKICYQTKLSEVLLPNHPPTLPKFLSKSKGGLGSRSKFLIGKKRSQQGKNPKKIFTSRKVRSDWEVISLILWFLKIQKNDFNQFQNVFTVFSTN